MAFSLISSLEDVCYCDICVIVRDVYDVSEHCRSFFLACLTEAPAATEWLGSYTWHQIQKVRFQKWMWCRWWSTCCSGTIVLGWYAFNDSQTTRATNEIAWRFSEKMVTLSKLSKIFWCISTCNKLWRYHSQIPLVQKNWWFLRSQKALKCQTLSVKLKTWVMAVVDSKEL